MEVSVLELDSVVIKGGTFLWYPGWTGITSVHGLVSFGNDGFQAKGQEPASSGV